MTKHGPISFFSLLLRTSTLFILRVTDEQREAQNEKVTLEIRETQREGAIVKGNKEELAKEGEGCDSFGIYFVLVYCSSRRTSSQGGATFF